MRGEGRLSGKHFLTRKDCEIREDYFFLFHKRVLLLYIDNI